MVLVLRVNQTLFGILFLLGRRVRNGGFFLLLTILLLLLFFVRVWRR